MNCNYSANSISQGETERTLKDALSNTINDVDYVKHLSVERRKSGEISIRAKSSIVVLICYRKKVSSFFMVRIEHKDIFSKMDYTISKDGEWIKIEFDTIDDILKFSTEFAKVYMIVLKTFEHESFGCCHRFMECSDAKKCVHPNEVKAEACQYKTNLEKGRIFYGKNRNID